jgi:hypothetical protein
LTGAGGPKKKVLLVLNSSPRADYLSCPAIDLLSDMVWLGASEALLESPMQRAFLYR